MKTVFNDISNIQEYYDEYLSLIKYYFNVKRPSIFVRYFNIDVDRSKYDKELDTTYDIYNISSVLFNVYELTPTYYIAPVVNNIVSSTDLAGRQLEAGTTLMLYTLIPRENDLVMFYPPIKSDEIFRVSNVRVSVNSLHSTQNLQVFEIDLEYAPIKDINNIKVINQYVYDLSIEKYITYDEYMTKINVVNNFKSITNDILKYYNPYFDVYCAELKSPYITNELIFYFKKLYNYKFNRLFEEVFTPYGYLDYVISQLQFSNFQQFIDFFSSGNTLTIQYYDFTTRSSNTIQWNINDTSTQLFKLLDLTYRLFQSMRSANVR